MQCVARAVTLSSVGGAGMRLIKALSRQVLLNGVRAGGATVAEDGRRLVTSL